MRPRRSGHGAQQHGLQLVQTSPQASVFAAVRHQVGARVQQSLQGWAARGGEMGRRCLGFAPVRSHGQLREVLLVE